jgi:hypothetical protein
MQVTITSGGIAAAVAVLTALAGFCLWVVRAIVRAENATQLKNINGTYVKSAGSFITGHDIERRLDVNEGDIRHLRGRVGA